MGWINPRSGKEISEAQAKRYQRAGISQAAYEKGTANLSAARGHANEKAEKQRRASGTYNDYYIKKARAAGLESRLPHFREYNKTRQRDLAKAFLHAFHRSEFPKSNPLSKTNKDAFRAYAQLAQPMRKAPGRITDTSPLGMSVHFPVESAGMSYSEALDEFGGEFGEAGGDFGYSEDYGGDWEMVDEDAMDWEEARADYKESMGSA